MGNRELHQAGGLGAKTHIRATDVSIAPDTGSAGSVDSPPLNFRQCVALDRRRENELRVPRAANPDFHRPGLLLR
jgi:hypothetical protein